MFLAATFKLFCAVSFAFLVIVSLYIQGLNLEALHFIQKRSRKEMTKQFDMQLYSTVLFVRKLVIRRFML